MTSCSDIRARIQLLVDGELTPEEQGDVFAHLETCRDCAASIRREETLVSRVRAARPTIQAPDSLRERIASLAAAHENQSRRPLPARRLWRWTPLAAAAGLAVAVTATLSYQAHLREQAANLDGTAVLVHRALQSEQLPLDIQSSSPEQVSAWFTQRVDFPFHLANGGIAADGEARYKLAGGRLVNVNGQPAALVSFHLSNESVSMLVAPGSMPINTHGTPVSSGGITLYARDQNATHIVSWKNRGLSYVLVSRTSMGSVNSCARCHAGSGSPPAATAQSSTTAAASPGSRMLFQASTATWPAALPRE